VSCKCSAEGHLGILQIFKGLWVSYGYLPEGSAGHPVDAYDKGIWGSSVSSLELGVLLIFCWCPVTRLSVIFLNNLIVSMPSRC